MSSQARIADIATHLGLSRVAVSKALNNRSGVSSETRERVLLTARKLGYEHPGLHQAGAPHVVCLLLSWPEEKYNYTNPLASSFYDSLVWEIERVASATGWQVMFKSLVNGSQIDAALASAATGFLVLGPIPHEHLVELYKRGLPAVMVNEFDPEIPLCSVMSAEVLAGEMVTRRLLARGHRKIAFVGPIGPAHSFSYRWLGYQLAMREAGADFTDLPQPDFRLWFRVNTVSREIAQQIDALDWRATTAYVLADARLGKPLCDELGSRDADLLRQIALAGFLHTQIEDIGIPPMILARLRIELMAKVALDLLQSISINEHAEPLHIKVLPEILE